MRPPRARWAKAAPLTSEGQQFWGPQAEAALVQVGQDSGVSGDVQATLNGKKLAGPIIMARVSADGSAWFVLRRDGSVDRSGW